MIIFSGMSLDNGFTLNFSNGAMKKPCSRIFYSLTELCDWLKEQAPETLVEKVQEKLK